jgi:hypothetical protein
VTRLLDTDPRLRKLRLIKKVEKGYTRSVLNRFIRKVGENNRTRIIEKKVVKLLKQNDAKEINVVFDASFIKARSTRHPRDSQNIRYSLAMNKVRGLRNITSYALYSV